jgi:hypothetical protein
VSELVERFNAHGLAALAIAAGRGRKPTYTSEQQARILAEVQRPPEREVDQTATWSRISLRRALRQTDLPEIAAETIRQVLHEAGYRDLRTRTWVRTGYALRVRTSGTVTTYDPETRGAKKADRAGLRAGGSRGDRAGERGRSGALSGHPAARGEVRSQRAIQRCSRMSTSVEEPPNC